MSQTKEKQLEKIINDLQKDLESKKKQLEQLKKKDNRKAYLVKIAWLLPVLANSESEAEEIVHNKELMLKTRYTNIEFGNDFECDVEAKEVKTKNMLYNDISYKWEEFVHDDNDDSLNYQKISIEEYFKNKKS